MSMYVGQLPFDRNSRFVVVTSRVLCQHTEASLPGKTWLFHSGYRKGGTFFVHMSIHVFPQVNGPFSRLARMGYAGFLRLLNIRAAVRRILMHVGGKPYMHGVSYEMQPLLIDLKALGFTDLAVSPILVRSGPGIHCCVSGRKPSA